MLLQQRRQTDGTCFVTSHGAEFDTRIHRFILFKRNDIQRVFLPTDGLLNDIVADAHPKDGLCIDLKRCTVV